jgi:hypothetical protein
MNPKIYQVEKDGKFLTVKSFNDAVGVVRGLFRIPGHYIPWVAINAKTTVVNHDIVVKEIDNIPLAIVKWCPQTN